MLSEKPWRAEAVLLFCAAQLACLCLGVAAAVALHKARVAGFRQPEDFGNLLVTTLSFQGATWLLISDFLRQHQTGWGAAFGWRGPHLKSALVTALKFIVVILPVVLLLQAASVWTLGKFGWPTEDQVAVSVLLRSQAWWATAYFGVFAVVIAPVAEEFIFRGMLFSGAKKLGWPKSGWIGASLLFALVHGSAPIFLPLFAFGLALTWLYEKTEGLLAPFAAHSLFNAANLIILLVQT